MTVNISYHQPVEEIPSTVDLTVSWLKAVPAIQAIVDPGSRISSSLPTRDEDLVYPWLTVGRIIGVTSLPEAAIDRARVQFTAHGGPTASGAPYWSEADQLIRAVEAEIRSISRVVVPGKGVIVSASGLEGIQQFEDPDTGGGIFWMDAIIVARKEST